jgi:hypothetical protein
LTIYILLELHKVIVSLVFYSAASYPTASNVQVETAILALATVDNDAGLSATGIAYTPRKRSCPVYYMSDMISVVLLKQSESDVAENLVTSSLNQEK